MLAARGAVGLLVAAFDMITVRELDVIRQLRDRHRRVRIAILDDESVAALYGRPPMTPVDERVRLAQHLRGVDEVVVHDPARPEPAGDPPVRYVIAGDPSPLPMGFDVLTPALVTAATPVNVATAAMPADTADTGIGEAVA